MFDRLVDRRVRAKAGKRQARLSGLAPTSLLVVDLAHAELSSELVDSAYRARSSESLRDRLGPRLLGYDAVSLCEWRAWGEETQLHFLIEPTGIDADLRQALFWSQLPSRAASA
jgi:hypothetical protein